MEDQLTSDKVAFWQTRYQQQLTPWDLGKGAPPFKHLLQENPYSLEPGKMAVLGSGYGNDAALFATFGFDVTGFDYVPEAISGAQDRYGDIARFELANIFNFEPKWLGEFDYVLEHTCFCAIRPDDRKRYVSAAASLLKDNGIFIGLFWAHQEWGGPPYKTDKGEIHQLFSPYFEILALNPVEHSTEERRNEELLGIFRKRAQ